MANYSLVINSKFQPFSFERYIQPYQIYGEAYKEVENAYSELSQKANVWEGLANEQTDPKTHAKYKAFADDLRSRADLLAREGLNMSSRINMLDMKSRYSSEIIPIERGYEAKQKYIDNLIQAQRVDPTLIVDRYGDEISLDEFVENPLLQARTVSGNDIMISAQTAAKAFAQEVRDDLDSYKSILGNSYYELKTKRGLTVEEVYNTLLNNENGVKALRQVMDNAVNATGVQYWNNERASKQAYYRAGLGAFSSVGETNVQYLDNWVLRQQRELALRREELALRKAENAENHSRWVATMRSQGYDKDGNPLSQSGGGSTTRVNMVEAFVIDTEGNVEMITDGNDISGESVTYDTSGVEGVSTISENLRNRIKSRMGSGFIPDNYTYEYISPGVFSRAKVIVRPKKSVILANNGGANDNVDEGDYSNS